MKIGELIRQLSQGDPNSDVVIDSNLFEGYTTSILVSFDDLGVAMILEAGSSKPY